MQRITGVIDHYAVILDPAVAEQLTRDRAALRARTVRGVRALKPSPDVLKLIAHLNDDDFVQLECHPEVMQGAVPAHPLTLMRADPALDDHGQVVQSAFLGHARLIPAETLDTLERSHGWTRSQARINAACGL